MADEGIGIVLIEKLAQMAAEGSLPADSVEYHDGGTGGIHLLHAIADRRKAVILDCCCMNTAPGTIKRFSPEDAASVKTMAHLSLHEADILKVIDLAKQLGQCPEEIVFFGIEPQAIEPKTELSPTLAAKIPAYLALIQNELLPQRFK